MRIVERIFGIVALVFFAAGACLAFSCRQPSAAESFQLADAVFLGQVVRGTEPYGEHSFRVLKSWKGVQENRVVVGEGREDWSYGFHLGETYVVYAKRSGAVLLAGECSGTRNLLNASEQLRDLQDRPAISLLPTLRNGYGYGYGRLHHNRAHGLDNYRPRRSFWNTAIVTGVSVLLFMSMGFVLPKLGRRFASLRRNK